MDTSRTVSEDRDHVREPSRRKVHNRCLTRLVTAIRWNRCRTVIEAQITDGNVGINEVAADLCRPRDRLADVGEAILANFWDCALLSSLSAPYTCARTPRPMRAHASCNPRPRERLEQRAFDPLGATVEPDASVPGSKLTTALVIRLRRDDRCTELVSGPRRRLLPIAIPPARKESSCQSRRHPRSRGRAALAER